MTNPKPHFRVIAGRTCEVKTPASKVEQARKRFGKPFAFESGSPWKPRETPYLTEWMATRTREKT